MATEPLQIDPTRDSILFLPVSYVKRDSDGLNPTDDITADFVLRGSDETSVTATTVTGTYQSSAQVFEFSLTDLDDLVDGITYAGVLENVVDTSDSDTCNDVVITGFSYYSNRIGENLLLSLKLLSMPYEIVIGATSYIYWSSAGAGTGYTHRAELFEGGSDTPATAIDKVTNWGGVEENIGGTWTPVYSEA